MMLLIKITLALISVYMAIMERKEKRLYWIIVTIYWLLNAYQSV